MFKLVFLFSTAETTGCTVYCILQCAQSFHSIGNTSLDKTLLFSLYFKLGHIFNVTGLKKAHVQYHKPRIVTKTAGIMFPSECLSAVVKHCPNIFSNIWYAKKMYIVFLCELYSYGRKDKIKNTRQPVSVENVPEFWVLHK